MSADSNHPPASRVRRTERRREQDYEDVALGVSQRTGSIPPIRVPPTATERPRQATLPLPPPRMAPVRPVTPLPMAKRRAKARRRNLLIGGASGLAALVLAVVLLNRPGIPEPDQAATQAPLQATATALAVPTAEPAAEAESAFSRSVVEAPQDEAPVASEAPLQTQAPTIEIVAMAGEPVARSTQAPTERPTAARTAALTPKPSAKPAPSATPKAAYQALKAGDKKRDDIKRMQTALAELGYMDAKDAIGVFGEKTKAAVKQFRQANELEVSEIADEAMLTLLYEGSPIFAPISPSGR